MKEKVKKGVFLIAEPFLNDPNFERSVIFLCEHSSTGSVGFVVNQETNLFLSDVIEENIYEEIPLFLGGPVEKNTLHFLHRRPDLIPGSVEIGNGIHWGGDFEQIKHHMNTFDLKREDIRCFIGYSGWDEYQLESEMDQQTWIVTDADPSFIFDTAPRAVWREVLKQMGGKYRAIAHYPIDPSLN